jgi:hypothetical protein
MSSASREFLLMRMEEEEGRLYVPTLPKKEIVEKAKADVEAIVDGGEVTIEDAIMDSVRIEEYIKVFTKELKKHLSEETLGKSFDNKGGNISFRGTGDRLDYEQDEVYASLKELLKEREDLLKTAYKSKEVIFDSEQNPVPKVGVKTPSMQTVVIKF